MKIEIVIPAYNEEKRIGKTLERYSELFDRLSKENLIEYEILVVINNTKDKTRDIVEKHKARNKKINYLDLKKKGKGYAIKEGFIEALKRKSELIGFVDADLSTSPEAFYDLVRGAEGYDGAIADRYIEGAIVSPKQSFVRIFVSRVFNFLIKVLFLMKYKDTQCGAKVFTRKAVEKIICDMTMTQWAFDIDLLYSCRKKGLRIKPVPTRWKDVEGSKLNVIRTSIQMFLAVIQLRILRSRFRGMLKVMGPIVGIIYKLVRR
jgi:glycosyltransferase involved in cell wall biosynthesis